VTVSAYLSKNKNISAMKKIFTWFIVASAALFTYSCSQNPNKKEMVKKTEINSGWKFSEAGKDDWKSAKVPGCIHTDLLAHKIIEDPFYRLNEHKVQWVDKKDWVYKTSFSVSDDVLAQEHVVLDFKGLDTYADVYLNGKEILKADNMFREWRVECKDL
jgi:beta-mannosidase